MCKNDSNTDRLRCGNVGAMHALLSIAGPSALHMHSHAMVVPGYCVVFAMYPVCMHSMYRCWIARSLCPYSCLHVVQIDVGGGVAFWHRCLVRCVGVIGVLTIVPASHRWHCFDGALLCWSCESVDNALM